MKIYFYRSCSAEKSIVFQFLDSLVKDYQCKYTGCTVLANNSTEHAQRICCLTGRYDGRINNFIFSERYQACSTTAPATGERSGDRQW